MFKVEQNLYLFMLCKTFGETFLEWICHPRSYCGYFKSFENCPGCASLEMANQVKSPNGLHDPNMYHLALQSTQKTWPHNTFTTFQDHIIIMDFSFIL